MNTIEIRINSTQDAKSVIRNQIKIQKTMELLKLEAINYVIANEVKVEVAALISGLFRCKTYNNYSNPLKDATLYQLPHYEQKPALAIPIGNAYDRVFLSPGPTAYDRVFSPEPVPAAIADTNPPEPKKKRGQPKGGWPKKVSQ